MKKNIYFISLILIVLCLYSVKSNAQNLKLHIPENVQNTAKTTYLCDSVYYYDWDTTNLSWKNNYKYVCTYNSQGLLIDISYFYWNTGTKKANFTERYYYTYYSNNKIKDILYQTYNTTSNMWVNSYVTSYTYTSFLENSTIESSYWNSSFNQWTFDIRYIYNYDANNVLTKINYEIYSNNAWNNNWKYDYSYENNNVSELLYSNWVNNAWQNYSKYKYGYNNNVKETTTYQTWVKNNWRNSEYYQYAYNQNNLNNEIFYSYWDTIQNVWVESLKYTNDYDANNNLTQVTTTYIYYGYWYNYKKENYYYSQYADNLVNKISKTNNLAVYPNPSKDFIYFPAALKLESIDLYNYNGQLVYSLQNNNLISSISIATLENGIYFLKAIDEKNQLFYTKLFKE